MVRVAAAAIRRTGPVQAGGKLVEIGFAHRHRPQGNQLSDNGRALRRPVSKRRTGSGGDDLRKVNIIFDRERHPVQRERLWRMAFQRRQKRRLLRFAQEMNKQIKLGIQRFRPLADRRQQGARGGVAVTIVRRQGRQA